MKGGTVTISKEEYIRLRKESKIDHEFLLKIVRGLEDIRPGRVKPWKKVAV